MEQMSPVLRPNSSKFVQCKQFNRVDPAKRRLFPNVDGNDSIWAVQLRNSFERLNVQSTSLLTKLTPSESNEFDKPSISKSDAYRYLTRPTNLQSN
jgi:hypothetical protein